MEIEPIVASIKSRLGIKELNPMQRRMMQEQYQRHDMVLCAPTGSGKTVAYILRLLSDLEPRDCQPQAVVLVPSRELAVQTADVLRSAVPQSLKVTVCYGGHSVEAERMSLCAGPTFVVATPGRLLDHITRGHFAPETVTQVVLDEFDKILDLGFSAEMEALMNRFSGVEQTLLTSATPMEQLPSFVRCTNPIMVDGYGLLTDSASRLTLWRVDATKDKMTSLVTLLGALSCEQSVVFVAERDDVEALVNGLRQHGIACVGYHGGMTQVQRELSLARFATQSATVLVATDLAARGLDISSVRHIIHYHLPLDVTSFTHRNGRTARVEATGDVYMIMGESDKVPDYLPPCRPYLLNAEKSRVCIAAPMKTLYIKAGKKEKISRADIVGYLLHASSDLEPNQIGKIIVFDHYAVVGVKCPRLDSLLIELNTKKLKGRRVRVTIVD